MAYSFLAPTTACNAPSAAKRRADAQNAQVVALARMPRACCWAGRHEGHHTVAVQKSQAKLQEVGGRQPVHCKLRVHGRRCRHTTPTGTRHTAHAAAHGARHHSAPAQPWTGTALDRHMLPHGTIQPCTVTSCMVLHRGATRGVGRVSSRVQPVHERGTSSDAGAFRTRLRLPRQAAASAGQA